jgi:Uma2 family endonuclease
VIVEMAQPVGDHEDIIGFLAEKITVEYVRNGLPYSIPKTVLVQSASSQSCYSPDLLLLNRPALKLEPLWQKYSTVKLANSIPLLIEVVSTNWRDDYHKNTRGICSHSVSKRRDRDKIILDFVIGY